jgi:hypothetical protein
MIRVLRESKEAPLQVQERVSRAGGANRFGEPNFRVMWGWNRLDWMGGKWTDRDAHGNVTREVIELRHVPKYVPHDRWHIERWMPPEIYGSPADWCSNTLEREDGILIPALGPYPARGEYEHCFTLQSPAGEFLALTPTVCDGVIHAIEWSRHRTPVERREAIGCREARLSKQWDLAAEKFLGAI